jgi:glycosyltransferase involved in cell wall biosynthesis
MTIKLFNVKRRMHKMNDEKPFTSIIIPTFNRSNILPKAIDSIHRQTYTHYEIIVVDDGSTDNTKKIITKYPEIKYIYQDNHGASSARNTGIQHAKGDFIAFLDSDDYWLPNKLELQVKIFLKNPLLWMVAGAKVKNKDRKLNDSFSNPNLTYDTKKITFLNLIEYNCINTPSVLVRRDIFEMTGLFDTNLKTGEDWDLWLRIACFGPVAFIKTPLVIINKINQSLSSDRYEIYNNNLKVFDKWNPLKNSKSPLTYKNFIKIVIKHFVLGILKLLKSGQEKEALLLWNKVNTVFHFTIYNKIYIFLYYHLICFTKNYFYPFFFVYSKHAADDKNPIL